MTIEEQLRALQQSYEKLKAENAELKKKKKFGLVWEEREREINIDDGEYYPYLVPKGNDFGFENGDARKNILIEGDNYHALEILQYTHKGKVDVIYIDPPYNTLRKIGFKYGDRYIHEDDGYKHSYWLSFMNKRLKLAKPLLCKTNGAVFISIDNNQQARLKLLCDDIFGEKNFVTCLHIQLSATQGNKVGAAKDGAIVKNGEYVLVYSRNENFKSAKVFYEPSRYDEHYSKFLLTTNKKEKFTEINIGDYILKKEKELQLSLEASGLCKENKALANNKLAKAYESNELFKEFVHSNSKNIIRDHIISDVKLSREETNNLSFGKILQINRETRDYLISVNSKNNINQRIRLEEKINLCDDFDSSYGISTIRGDWWSGFYLDMGNVSKEGDMTFKNGKKPIRLISQLIQMGTDKKDITVMDFFAGSGTTGHAVMDLNKQDNGKRKYILCTNNENNICEDVCYERLKKANEKYGYNSNLEYLKTELLKYNPEKHSDLDIKEFMVDKLTEIIKVRESCFALEDVNSHLQKFNKDEKSVYIVHNIYKMKKNDYDEVVEILNNDTRQDISIYILSISNHSHYANKIAKANKNITFEPLPENFLKMLRKLERKCK